MLFCYILSRLYWVVEKLQNYRNSDLVYPVNPNKSLFIIPLKYFPLLILGIVLMMF